MSIFKFGVTPSSVKAERQLSAPKPNIYIGVPADTEENARAELSAYTSEEIGRMIHREAAEDPEEFNTFVFEVFDAKIPELLPAAVDHLWDLFDLPDFPNLPYFDISDSFA